jgi:hypothetical protein
LIIIKNGCPGFFYMAQQQKDRLPGGILPELSRKARKAVEEGGLSRKSGVLNHIEVG